ncbi:head-tail joining protein [Undibacterium sp. SXout11W]|uniref:head-tail joining protein n=1 Tax=Undibacterium sp. SXout11W TaxID=3413050 RepID=UPI003BF22A57
MSGGAWQQSVKDGFKRLTAFAGVDAVFTDISGTLFQARVLFSQPSADVLGAMQISNEYAIEFDPDDLPGLKHKSPITVDGNPYTVREAPKNTEDGFTRLATLTKE